MTESAHQSDRPGLDVTLAGVRFRSPIGLAPIGGGSHFGKREADPDREAAIALRFLLDNVRAGSSCVYLNFSYLTKATLDRLIEASGSDARPHARAGWAERTIRAKTGSAPYGVEGLYSMVSPGPGMPNAEAEERLIEWQRNLIAALKSELPAGVPIVGGVIGCGGLPDAYVEAAVKCEELGVDLIELNFHCPLQAGMRGAVDSARRDRFPAFSQGGLMVEHPQAVGDITRAVVAAARIPVGAKFSAEAGFPRIVELARRIRDAGARYISVGGAAVGIAPPDIYNGGRPLWPLADGNAFCLTSGAWMRRTCYRDVAAVARFVPGLDIVASGGLVTPDHCVEAMMLGATVAQVCTGVLEQGRSLLRRSTRFLERFLTEQGYAGARELIGLGQAYIKYPEDLDLSPGRVVSRLHEERCTRCGRCLDNLCIAIHSDHGEVVVDTDKCAGCGACTIACDADAFELIGGG